MHLVANFVTCFCQVDIGQGNKAPGYYVHRSGGLFPAPRPHDDPDMPRVEELFRFIGRFFAKCIQDGRLVDLPLARPFLKLLCMSGTRDVSRYAFSDWSASSAVGETTVDDDDRTPTEENAKELSLDAVPSTTSSVPCGGSGLTLTRAASRAWYAGLLNDDDFAIIDPMRARFLCELRVLLSQYQAIQANAELDDDERRVLVEKLCLGHNGAKLDDLG